MSVSPSPSAAGQPPFAAPPAAQRSKGTIVTGIVLAVVGIVVPIVFVVAQLGKLESADAVGVPLGRGKASIDMTAGHAYDLLTEREGRLDSCVLDGPEGTETVSVRARSSRIEYAVGDRQDAGDDVVPGVWYVAGSIESPMNGNVTVRCDGEAATGALTLIPDDDVYGGLGILFIGGGLVLIAGVITFVVGVARKRPVRPAGSFGGYAQPGYPMAGVPAGAPVGAGAGAPAGGQMPHGGPAVAPPVPPAPASAPWEVSYQPPAQSAPSQESGQPSAYQPWQQPTAGQQSSQQAGQQQWQPQPWQPASWQQPSVPQQQPWQPQQPAQQQPWQPQQPAPQPSWQPGPSTAQLSSEPIDQSSGQSEWKPREWQPRDWSLPTNSLPSEGAGNGGGDGADHQDGENSSKDQ
jgi:hypothetical protein